LGFLLSLFVRENNKQVPSGVCAPKSVVKIFVWLLSLGTTADFRIVRESFLDLPRPNVVFRLDFINDTV